jgi:hypothetical protein
MAKMCARTGYLSRDRLGAYRRGSIVPAEPDRDCASGSGGAGAADPANEAGAMTAFQLANLNAWMGLNLVDHRMSWRWGVPRNA